MSQRKILHDVFAEMLAKIHQASRGYYGAHRIRAEVGRGLCFRVGRDQVALVV